MFQSTLLYKERLSRNSTSDGSFVVSIHAPVQGATAHRLLSSLKVQVSIHAPVQGATHSGS